MARSLLSDEKRIELMNIYRDNPAAAARDLLGSRTCSTSKSHAQVNVGLQ